MLVNTFLASLAAKLAMATGLAVATVSAAGAAGVLPDPAQNVVASVVEATTPFSIPNATAAADVLEDVDDIDDVTTTTLGTSTSLPGTDADDDSDGTTDGTRKVNHGACVSTVAKNTPGGPDHGKTVSSVARSDCGKTSASTSTTVAPTTSSTVAPTSSTSSTSTTVAGVTSANSGKGNSGNSGNTGKGNSGKN
jgi:hypothetical protein